MFETNEDFKQFLKLSDKDITIIKFTANWCGPCKRINPFIQKINNLYKNKQKYYRYIEVDVDDNSELYKFFKRRKMIQGIPSFCLYYKDKFDEDMYYVPHKIVTGANESEISNLFRDVFGNLN